MDCRNDLMAIDQTKHKGDSIAQMVRTVDVFEAEILSEVGDWATLGHMIDVRSLDHYLFLFAELSVQAVQKRSQLQTLSGGQNGHSLETVADVLSNYPNCPTRSERRIKSSC